MNKFKIEILSKLENVSIVRVAITSFLSNYDVTVDDIMDIKTAVSEAVTNSIEHAYNNKSENYVFVEVKINYDISSIVEISVKDFGIGIENIELAMTPAYTSKPELEHAGLGFSIMDSFMDQVIIDTKVGEGTTICMLKEIKNKKSV